MADPTPTKSDMNDALKGFYSAAGIDTSKLEKMAKAYMESRDKLGTDPAFKKASQEQYGKDVAHYMRETRNLMRRGRSNKEVNKATFDLLAAENRTPGIAKTADILETMKEKTAKIQEHVTDANPKGKLSATVFSVRVIPAEELLIHINKSAFIAPLVQKHKEGRTLGDSIYIIHASFNPRSFDKTPANSIKDPMSSNIDINRTARLISFYSLKSKVPVEPKARDTIEVVFSKPDDFSFGEFTGTIIEKADTGRGPIDIKKIFKGSNRVSLGSVK